MSTIPPLLEVELESAKEEVTEATMKLAVAKDRLETLQVACKIVADHNAEEEAAS